MANQSEIIPISRTHRNYICLRVIGTNPKTTNDPKPPLRMRVADFEFEDPNIAITIPTTRIMADVQR